MLWLDIEKTTTRAPDSFITVVLFSANEFDWNVFTSSITFAEVCVSKLTNFPLNKEKM